MEKGIIFNIQKFSIHDGPGIRTLVFLKGCPLNCRWCANPEGISPTIQIAFKKSKCLGVEKCGICIHICPQQAIASKNGFPKLDYRRCDNCEKCIVRCPSKALFFWGEYKTVDEVLTKVKEDSVFYRRSDGGITLSGGEALLQADFSSELLQKAKSIGMRTALETTCYAPWNSIKRVVPYVDHLFIDLKSASSEKHKLFTGVDPSLIWENASRICKVYREKRIVFRTPVVPDFNNSSEEIQKIVDIIVGFNPDMKKIEYELLPYHAFGISKYETLGLKYIVNSKNNMMKTEVENLIKDVEAPFNISIG